MAQPQSDLAKLLSKIVSESDFYGIIVFDVISGLPLFANSSLELELGGVYKALFDTSTDTSNLDSVTIQNLKQVFYDHSRALSVSAAEEIDYDIVRFKEGAMNGSTMMTYFSYLPDTKITISFLSDEKVNLGNVVFQSRRKIREIVEAINNT
jgi:hypothetical protein